jgi:predicted AlkP superfamily pyrophosphatase or phosphodiesterase
MMKPALFGLLVASGLTSAVHASPVLLISIDGLRPDDITQAEQRGLKIPNLRRFVRDGASATGVRGILPTVTYPSHATLLTGTSPAKHGIVSNTTFDPKQINQGGWYWYTAAFRVPTLWDVVRQAGLTVGNVHWPVSVGAKAITWNLPQIWRTGHADDADLIKALATPGLIADMETRLGAYAPGIDESIEGDENRGRFGVDLIATKTPDFTTVYLTALDHEQHGTGPGSPEAHAVLERIDTVIGKLVSAEMKAHPDATVAIVSDHGFSKTDTEISLFRAFIDAGLISLDGDGKVKDWKAMPWPSGGSAAIVLAQPDDADLRNRVGALLTRLKADRTMRIAAIADKDAIAAMNGNPMASFYVDFDLGTYAAGFKGAAAPISAPSASKGMHGYFPGSSEMRSTFLIMGKGIAAGKSLGEIDMGAIAPTLAKILGVTLKNADMSPLNLIRGP